MAKVDLTLLKKLIIELEDALEIAETVKADKNEYVIELAKAAGLAAGVMQEGGGIVGDIAVLTSGNPAALSAKPDNFLDKLLGIKPTTGKN